MKNLFIYTTLILSLFACTEKVQQNQNEEEEHHESHQEVILTPGQLEQLEMKTGKPENKKLAVRIQTNGILEVAPNSEAVVTAIMAAKVTSIKVIEGQEVKKGQVLAYFAEPAFTELQSRYMETFHKAAFAEQEYHRQKKLYQEEVGSGKTFQQVESEYRSLNSMIKSLQQQLRQLGMDPGYIEKGNFYKEIAAVSPINGFISAIDVKTGQYVQPDKELFEIINTESLYAELRVYEKDIDKIKVGQRINFSIHTFPGMELKGKIYSIGKKFEENPKAVFVYANIDNSSRKLIAGMYVKGDILEEGALALALPQEAITLEGEQYFAFRVSEKSGNRVFTPVEVFVLGTENGWSAISFKEDPGPDAEFALNNAYYLWADMKKDANEHEH